MEAIKTMGLTKYYGKERGIINLDLLVKEGEFFGFIGPNGAGKSTTIRTLLGLLKPTDGKAAIFGKDIQKEQTEIRKQVGYLPSEAIFYQGMKVKDILKLSADLRKKNCEKEAKKLCERLQLDPGRKVEELSFGNRKKVGIVCALLHEPKLLILDEPTSGLDPLMQREFFQILKERNEEGTTVFLSSHILSEIQRNCTRAAIIREGSVTACDSVENLMKNRAKRVTVHGEFKPDFLKGVKDLKQIENGISFLYAGDINELIYQLSQKHMTDLVIAEPDLEEVFMHYYQDGGETA
ncbi:MAG: ABC transporter ATP-binding protein [Lachnospiraceae bacterium]|nr:ABC transporter ATP-binding protein [Lachnospiraceae bacterium]